MKSVAVIGLGDFGFYVAVDLSQKGFYVIGIDSDDTAISDIKDTIDQAVLVDCTDEAQMRAASIHTVDIAVVAIGSNVQSSLLSTALLKKFDIDAIYVRVIDSLQDNILASMKVKNRINIAKEMGEQLSHSIASETIKYIQISTRHSIVEIRVPELFIGKTLANLHLRHKYAINVIGIKTKLPEVTDEGDIDFIEDMTDVPDPNYPLKKEDVLIIMGTNNKIEHILDKLS